MDAEGAFDRRREMMIVLHTTRYGDSSLIVHGYTREEGRTSLMLRGAFRTSGKRRPSHPGAVLQYCQLCGLQKP